MGVYFNVNPYDGTYYLTQTRGERFENRDNVAGREKTILFYPLRAPRTILSRKSYSRGNFDGHYSKGNAPRSFEYRTRYRRSFRFFERFTRQRSDLSSKTREKLSRVRSCRGVSYSKGWRSSRGIEAVHLPVEYTIRVEVQIEQQFLEPLPRGRGGGCVSSLRLHRRRATFRSFRGRMFTESVGEHTA